MNRGGSFRYVDGKLVEHIKPTFDPYLTRDTSTPEAAVDVSARAETAPVGETALAEPSPAQEGSAASTAPAPADQTLVDEKRLERLQAAMVELNETDETLWTAGRKPRVEVLEQVLGEAITSAERDAAWKALNETSQES